jgi:hypothetical protein
MISEAWEKIFKEYNILQHDFKTPFKITADEIKKATASFQKTKDREVRILCKQDHRNSRPDIFIENGLFILPIKNGEFVLVKGEGYVDIPKIKNSTKIYKSKLDFKLDTSLIGNSEMQHLDFAYASSLIRTFLNDDSLVLTIRGRKYTPSFSFFVNHQFIETKSVQTEVDAGYEGRKQIVLIEAKNSKTKDTIIRQLFYPFKQWKTYTKKKVITLFFEKQRDEYSLWNFEFYDEKDYNSIRLIKSEKYKIIEK